MKRILLFLSIIFILPTLIYAQDDWNYDSQNLIINIDVASEALIKPTSSDYSVNYISINLSHFPYESFNQEIINFRIEPEAGIENNSILFKWQSPINKVNFGYNTKVKTNNNIIKVKEKIKFPILDLPEELKQFTQPSEIIDSDDEDVMRFASGIAEGEDDLYVVVHKIAEWTKNNVKYNLSSLTEEVSQKASWVLDNRQGVCDELTSLFIAMLRSLGVPAKFVAGVAYTNDPSFSENWGSHGWAEVYFPGYGWIPFDVTYGQFGYIDPTHVKLKESIDSNEPSVQYKWVARNINLETKELNIETSLQETVGRVKKQVSLDLKVLKPNIGFGSYNLVEAVLENLENYYVSPEVYISRPEEVEVIGDVFKNLLLKPNEKKSVFWIVKLADDLQKNFIYTFPITVSTLMGFEKSASFQSKKEDITYSFEKINSILNQRKEEEEKIYSKDVNIICSIDKKEFYSYERALAQCKIKNTGNTVLKNLDICFEDKCNEIDLGITQEKSFNYTVEKSAAGKQESVFKAKNADVAKANYIEYDVMDKPEIKIKDIEFPNEVNYEDDYQVRFLFSKESSSIPHNIKIALSQNNFEKTWTLKELPDDRKFVVNLLGKNLKKGTNEFNIIVEYEDGNGKAYETRETFSVELVNVTLIQNILLAFNQFVLFLENLI